MFNCLQAWPPAPFDLGLVHRQRQSWPAPEQGLQRACALDARELVAQAVMNAGTEGDMPVRFPREIELLRMLVCPRIQVGRRQHGNDLFALLQPDAAELGVLAHIAW